MFALFLGLLVACEKAEPPTLSILAPTADSTVAVGDVAVSVIVEHFDLTTPTTTARHVPFDPLAWLPIPVASAHGDEGEVPQGWVAIDLDGVEVLLMGTAQGTVPDVVAGAHTLTATLIHEDGEPVDPIVTASAAFTAE